MATTPPPTSAIRTPPTPRHGAKYDLYEPYSPRRSERIASRCLSQDNSVTPDSDPSGHSSSDGNHQHTSMLTGGTLSPPHSQHNTPKRRSERNERHSHLNLSPSQPPKTKSKQGTTTTSHPPRDTMDTNGQDRTTLVGGMLPTPMKTPRKKTISDIGTTQRILFPNRPPAQNQETTPKKRTKGKKFAGFSLESFESNPEQTEQGPITIFTDSRDRVPQPNSDMENPFRTRVHDAASPSANAADGHAKRRKLDNSPKRAKNVEKAIHRDDGLLYVFRGKKVFRKFSQDSDNEEDDSNDLGLLATRPDHDNEHFPRFRHMTRSSVKPRVLFPNATPSSDRVIEDSNNTTSREPSEPENEVNSHQPETTDTPTAPITPPSKKQSISTPTSPLATGRSLRSHIKKAGPDQDLASDDSDGAAARRRFSPFNKWWRTKTQTTPTKTRKRTGSTLKTDREPEPKKLRSE